MKIEGDNVSAFEVAHHLDVLKANIEMRKEEKYLDPKTEKEKSLLVAAEHDKEQLDAIFTNFYGKHQ